MIDSFSTPRNRIKTLALLMVCGLSALAAIVIGIDDNPPGILLALLAAITIVLAFVHPWRTARKFMFLLLTSVLGFVFFVVQDIIFDSIVQNPATSNTLKHLMYSPVNDALNLILVMLCTAAFIIGTVGSITMFIHGHRQKN